MLQAPLEFRFGSGWIDPDEPQARVSGAGFVVRCAERTAANRRCQNADDAYRLDRYVKTDSELRTTKRGLPWTNERR
jgi:hypothetical protein